MRSLRRSRKGKAKVQRDAMARATKRVAEASQAGQTPPKRVRHEGTPTDAESQAAEFADLTEQDVDWDDEPGYQADDDDSDAFEPADSHAFDLEDLTATLLAANEEDTVLVENEDGEEQILEEDFALNDELRALADYQNISEVGSQDDEAEGINDNDDDVATDIETSATEPTTEASITVASSLTAAPGVRPQQADPFAGSKPINNQGRKDHGLNDFTLALGLYCLKHGVSRKQYASMLEILRLLEHGDGLKKLRSLPETVDTLKRHAREEIPHIQIRSMPVALNPKKLSSSRKIASLTTGIDQPKQDLFYMNPVDLFTRVLGSRLTKNMHFGLAELVDSPSEAWHSAQWAGSIRTTSGQCAMLPARDGVAAQPILPGDFVDYECAMQKCKICHKSQRYHTGQVMGVYRDLRKSTRLLGAVGGKVAEDIDTTEEGSIVLVIGRVWAGTKLLDRKPEIKTNPVTKAQLTANELILCVEPVELVVPGKVDSRNEVISFDYGIGSEVKFDDDPSRNIPNMIRRIYNRAEKSFMPPCRVSPVPGVLEVNQFGREELITNFLLKPDGKVLSLPLFNFNDGFGLYRTLHKSIMGVYLQAAALPKSEGSRQMNIFPLTLGPHGSNFQDVMRAVEPIRALDRGITTKVTGEDKFVCTPILALTGDMVQQQENSGCLGVAAKCGCRACMATTAERGDLEYNVVKNARGHMELTRLRRAMDEQTTKRAKQKMSTQYGISIEPAAVVQICPALDLVAGRPGDSAHSEFGGITKMFHQLLLDVALTKAAVVEYTKVLRRMPFPPGWGRLASPYHILKYDLTEHARWSVLFLVVCLMWLKESHLKKPFVQAMRRIFSEDLQGGMSVVDVITKTVTGIVKTNALLLTDEMSETERNIDNFMGTIKTGRAWFQRMCQAAAMATTAPGGAAAQAVERRLGQTPRTSRATTPVAGPSSAAVAIRGMSTRAQTRAMSAATTASAAPSRETSAAPGEVHQDEPVESVEIEETEDVIDIGRLTTAQKAVKYNQWAARPNVHAGLHYFETARRYSLVSLLMALPGELKHKQWKNLMLMVNHVNPEKDCLMYEDMQQALRLALLGAYDSDDPVAAAKIQALDKKIPTLFASLLPHDYLDKADAEDEGDPTVTLRVAEDDKHRQPSALVRLNGPACISANLPQREKKMSGLFEDALVKAYTQEYGKNVIITTNRAIKWFKKLSFGRSANVEARRSMFHRGEFITYIREGVETIGRLEQIMTHEILTGRQEYVFLLVTPVDSTGRTESVTSLPIVKPRAGDSLVQQSHGLCQHIIGLPALQDAHLYLVPYTIDEQGHRNMVTVGMDIEPDAELLHVHWRLRFEG